MVDVAGNSRGATFGVGGSGATGFGHYGSSLSEMVASGMVTAGTDL